MSSSATSTQAVTEPEILDVVREQNQAHDRAYDQVTIRLRVQPELCWFIGHFPAVPLLPGVVQTTWVVAFGRRYFSLPARFSYMSNMKFMRFILPDTQVELCLRYFAGKRELAFEYRQGAAVCASGRMGFEA